jgi:hypothetical protein
MPTQTSMICTSYTTNGNQVVMQANQSQLPSALGSCTAVVATNPPRGTYNTITGPANDTATINVSQSEFNSLTSELAAGAVELTITHNGSTVTDFNFQSFQGFARAASAQLESQVAVLKPADLKEDVTAIRTRVEAIASELAEIRGAVEELLRRLGRAA